MQYQRSITTFMTLISWLVVYAASLFDNGKTDYKIVLCQDASVTERTAAEELRTYLKLVSGAEIPIISSSDAYIKGHHIFIGYHHRLAKKTSMIKPDPEDDGFTYKTSGDNLYIYGGKQRGTMFGVYAFLENELGIRWYTKDVTKIPTMTQYVLPSLNHSESPVVKYRFVEFKHFHTDAALYAHNKMNMVWDSSPTKYGKLHNYWGIHTSETLVPTKKYFNTHPEFFSYRNGKRVPHSQLCLSNPEVLKVVVSTLKTKINTVINYWGYDVSQNDNQLYCECDRCKAIERQFGGHSGIWIWFVNQVAAQLPHITIGTFAYQYTRHAPKNIKPRSNVLIRLCSIECCFAHPLETCAENRSFMKDFRNWKKLTDNIFIWDYVVNFNQYLLPFPNLAVLKPNLQTFVKNNAVAVLESGQYTSGDGEFSEMKAWIISKLLWNPQLDTDSLINDFVYGYYGKAAPCVIRYIRLCQSLVQPNTHFGCHIKGNHKVFTARFITKAEPIIQKAYQLAENEEVRRRVKMIDLQILYLKFVQNRIKSFTDGTYQKLLQIIKDEHPYINEGISADDFIKKQGYI